MQAERYGFNMFKNFSLRDKIFYISAAVFAVALIFLIYNNIRLSHQVRKYDEMYNQQLEINKQLSDMLTADSQSDTEDEQPSQKVVYGTKEELGAEIRSKIFGNTITENSPVGYDDLCYLSIPYHNFSGEHCVGHMIVNKSIADEVIDIFYKLYELNYPIEAMELAEDFSDKQSTLLNSLELASMGSNNTCSLYYKTDSSLHSYGLAIDINPKVNPSIDENGAPVPKTGLKYLNRNDLSETEQNAIIHAESEIYKIFDSYGWKWGGTENGEPACFYKEVVQ